MKWRWHVTMVMAGLVIYAGLQEQQPLTHTQHGELRVPLNAEASVFFAKGIRISESEYIGLSLNAGFSYMDGRFSQLDPQDPAFREDVKETDALVGFGLMLYRPERYYVGLSLPRLMLGNLGAGGGDSRYDFRNLYHLTAGALFNLGADFQFRPSLLVSYSESLRPQAEASAIFFVKRVFGIGWGAGRYRTGQHPAVRHWL